MKQLLIAIASTIILLLSPLFTPVASAIPLTSTSIFTAGDSQVTLDEVALSDAEPVTTQFAPYGVTFSSGLRSGTVFTDPANFSGQFLASAGATEPYSIFFVSDVDAAGAYWEFDAPRSTTIAAYLNGNLVESYVHENLDCCTTTAFLGFQGIVFDEIRVSDLVEGTSLILDNIHFSDAAVAAVPEPFSLALLGIGIAGLLGARRRQPA